MKKKDLKSLKLKKQSISNLNRHTVKGGITPVATRIADLIVDVAASVANGLEGDCVNTWGDEGCPTGYNGIC